MNVPLTWKNMFALVVMFLIFAYGIEWRFNTLQSQLADRMRLFEREVNLIEKRLDNLEKYHATAP